MKSITPTELRQNLYNLLDQVLETGIPLEISRKGKRLRIAPVETLDKLQCLVSRPEVINGDPEDLVALSWEGEINLDLP
ncbi:type II toxin-antitoxin system Phd/YefM family antitoxin [Synechocystis salina LEGE 06099]|uniref:type II toxin-antitoxin system Phd/YefM family antitoxin n=1 Tax=Synechocystis salina TaxID=945780 RepID=UPI00187E0170|nr:type II toxin-antitoxin system Phd/YefM family antitoxin [Synechocystis salina]MBE9204894.1 type II toxin-antitoxin system Phd/YefM family antitoxin [Synechocystis salina LEGE 06099]